MSAMPSPPQALGDSNLPTLPTTSTAAMKSEQEGLPLEMSDLDKAPAASPSASAAAQAPDTPTEFQDALEQPHPPQSTASADPSAPSTPLDALTRKDTEHLGPATDAPIVHTITHSGPVLSISLMLTTGARHPYKIDEKYLRNRKVTALNADGEFDPKAISGYQLKELIWTDWRSEWDPRPVSPSSIRLIVMGRMIEDQKILRDFPFNLATTNVVHMTVKPADLIDDDEAGAAKGTGKGSVSRMRDTDDGGAGCRCVIL